VDTTFSHIVAMSSKCALLVVCVCFVQTTFALSVDRNPSALSKVSETEYDDQGSHLSPWGEYVPKDPSVFTTVFGKALDDAHAEHVTKMLGREESRARQQSSGNGTVNVVISIRDGEDLPPFCDKIMRGEWGQHVSLSIYVKHDGTKSDEMRVIPSGIHEMIQIPNIGRNEHAYALHLARKAPDFADVEIFTKTNVIHDDKARMEKMVKYMVDLSRNGTYESVSFPWAFDRRYLNVRCDPAWRGHSLYQEFCDGASSAKGGMIKIAKYKDGIVPLYMVRQSSPGDEVSPDFLFALRTLGQPLPLVHETYGEGMFAWRRDVLTQLPADWYREFKRLMYEATASGTSAETHSKNPDRGYTRNDVKHHDDAMMAILPLLFSRAAPVKQDFPAWLVSPSTLDLFDTVENMFRFYEPGPHPDSTLIPTHAAGDPGCECPPDALGWYPQRGRCHCLLASQPAAKSGRWVKVSGQPFFAVPGRVQSTADGPGTKAGEQGSAADDGDDKVISPALG